MTATTAGASKVVSCCHCGGPVRVSVRAISVCCPHCQKRVALEDVVITGVYAGRSLITCGNVVVQTGAKINIPVQAQNVTVRGTIQGPVVALDTLTVETGGRVIGDVQARRLQVRDGGVVAGACRLITAPPRPTGLSAQSSDAPASASGIAPLPPSTLPAQFTPSSAPVLRAPPLNPVRPLRKP